MDAIGTVGVWANPMNRRFLGVNLTLALGFVLANPMNRRFLGFMDYGEPKVLIFKENMGWNWVCSK